MNILLLGATGYLGHKLIKPLQKKAQNIICTRRENSNIDNLQYENVRFVNVDISDIEKIMKEIHFDWIINIVCSYSQGTLLYQNVIESNIVFPLGVLNLAALTGADNFLTIGTGLPEEFNMYSFSKKMFSDFGRFYTEKHKLNFCNIKLEMFYGEDEPSDRFIPRCIHKMMKNEELPLTIGHQQRDIVYVEDVCDAIIFILEKGIAGHQVIPIGTGEGPTVNEVVTYMHDILGSESYLNFGAVPLRPGEPNSIADMRILNHMGFQIKYPWKKGISRMIEQVLKSEQVIK